MLLLLVVVVVLILLLLCCCCCCSCCSLRGQERWVQPGYVGLVQRQRLPARHEPRALPGDS